MLLSKCGPLQEVGDVEVNASYHSLEQYISALKPHLGNDKHLRNMAAAGGSADKTGKGAPTRLARGAYA